MKKLLTAAAAFVLASAAFGQLSSQYKDWAKSPEAYFLTVSEKQQWSKIASDADAEKFIADYWAKRGGAKFKDVVARRIAAADQQFKLRRQKGSESVRGRIFITLGNPTKVTEAREGGDADTQNPGAGGPTGAGGAPQGNLDTGPGLATPAVIQTWTYAKDHFDPSWDIGEIVARISVDPQRGTDELMNAGPVNKGIDKVVEHSISAASAPPAKTGTGAAPVQPAAPAAATGTAATAAPPAPATAALPAATRSVLEPLAKAATDKPAAGFWGGPFQTVDGEPFYAFQIIGYGKKDTPLPAAMKVGGIVTKEDGTEATTFWEDAAAVDLKGREGTDKVVDHSVALPPGSYRGAFGLFSADGATSIATVSEAFKIPEKATEFRVSPLILASTLTPLTKRPNPTDPFVFGMEKPIRVEPQGNGVYRREDALWYFFTVSHPAIAPDAAAAAPAAPVAGAPASPTPAGADAAAAAPAPDAPKPRVMTRIGVLKDGQPAFKPVTSPAQLQQLGPNYFAAGSEIPLASFAPGYYTFTLNLRDLNAPRDSEAFKGVDRSGDFVVLTVDGTMPPTPAPTKPTPAPKPRPKKS